MARENNGFDEQGVDDAAILLMSLGEEEAAEVFKHLAPREVQRLGESIAKMKAVSRERFSGVLDRFISLAHAENVLVPDNDEYVKSVLRRALGDDKAGVLIDRILQGSDVSGIESLKWMDAQSVGELLRHEHPQICAAVLVHLDPEQVAGVLKTFGERHRNDVMTRIATLDGIQPIALRDLNEVFRNVLVGGDNARRASLGGVDPTAEILGLMGGVIEASVLDHLREVDPDLAQKIVDKMFTFDDLQRLDDRGMQTVLKEVQGEQLVLALKGASPEMRDKVFRNMSSRAAEMLRDDMESRGPVRLTEVENEQKEIVKIVRRLIDEGQVQMSTGANDAFV
jgi:flagellar motor switch protein FliG